MKHKWTRPLTPAEAAREEQLADVPDYGGWFKLFVTPLGHFSREYRKGEPVMHIELVRDDRQLTLEDAA